MPVPILGIPFDANSSYLRGAAQVRRVGVEGNAENGYRHGVIIRAGLSASTKFFSHYLSVNDCLGYARVGSICESRKGLAAASLVVGGYLRHVACNVFHNLLMGLEFMFGRITHNNCIGCSGS